MSSLVLGIILIAVLYLIFSSTKKTQCPLFLKRGNVVKNIQPAVNSNSEHNVINDYGDYIRSTSLEKGVIDSHKQFVDDSHHTTTGASARSVLSGDVYDVPFVGLRRPNTQDIYVDPEARQVTTAETWQYPSDTRYDKCGLF